MEKYNKIYLSFVCILVLGLQISNVCSLLTIMKVLVMFAVYYEGQQRSSLTKHRLYKISCGIL